MSEAEPKTERYEFTQSKLLHLLGPGGEFKKEDMIPIQCYGDEADVSRMTHEFLAAAPEKHWYAEVNVPKNVTAETRLYSTVLMTPPAWALTRKLYDMFGIPDAVSGRPRRAA